MLQLLLIMVFTFAAIMHRCSECLGVKESILGRKFFGYIVYYIGFMYCEVQ